MWYFNLKKTLFILSVILLPSLETVSTKTQENNKANSPIKVDHSENSLSKSRTTLLTKIGDSENDNISNKSVTKSTKISSLENDISNTRIQLPTKIKPENYQSNRNKTSTTKLDYPENDLTNRTQISSTEIDDPDNDQSNGSLTSLSDQINERTTSSNKTDGPEYDLSNRNSTSSTKIDDPEHGLTPESLTTPTSLPHLPQENSPLSIRRQQPGQYPQLQPPTDPEISRLLNEYREIAKKYGHGSPNAPGADYNEDEQFDVLSLSNNNERTNGPGGTIHHNALWKKYPSSGVIRQGDDTASGAGAGAGAGPFGQAPTVNPNAPPPSDKPGSAQGTTQNEAQGAASRFTTRTTTTHRRRRTTPYRVSLIEDCDYLAYYCLKTYETGQVCARTIYFRQRTFKNYCMVDYVNCMERHDIWVISHMGACFALKVLTEYRYLSYNDESFLDNYYVVEDV